MNRATLIQVQTKVLLKNFLANEFSFLDSKLVRVHIALRRSFQVTLPVSNSTNHNSQRFLSCTKFKEQTLAKKLGGPQVRSGACLPPPLHLWSRSASLESLSWSPSGKTCKCHLERHTGRYHYKVSKSC